VTEPWDSIAIWDRFPPGERLAINFTLTCNLACAHCIVESSPHRRERLTLDEVRFTLTTGRRKGKKHVTFSGGEVFLFPAEMCVAITSARELGYVVDVETNAYWGRNDAMARKRLAPFAEAGVSGLSLSADAYHVAYFPVDRVINAARAARSYGMLTEINFCPSSDLETDEKIIAALESAGEPFIRNELLNRGRGSEVLAIEAHRSIDQLPDCDSLTTTVHATGDVYACCELETSTNAMKRTPVFLGSIRSAGEGLAVSSNGERLVTAFHDPDSPIYFRKLVRDHPLFRELAGERFASICDFCLRALGDSGRVAQLSAMLNGQPGGVRPPGQ
jgi:MoaA/NifB/PqqE/SkfB family radical SAM enzyme